METTTTTDTRSADEIEREIRRTQSEMSETADRLGDQLTPRNLINGLLDKADENGVDARYLLDAARRNPLALGMIAIGGIWLASDSDARLNTLTSGLKSDDKQPDWDDDRHHRSYVDHMASIEPRADEDPAMYQRRRDQARATFLLVEQRHDEDEGAFRKRLDQATDTMRERREKMMGGLRSAGSSSQRGIKIVAGKAASGLRSAGSSSRQGVRTAADKAASAYQSNPLIGGIAAAFAGAIAGAAMPVTRVEEENFGKMGSQALDMAKDKARQAGDMARDKKNELVEKADRKMSGGSQGDDGNETRMPNPQFNPA